MQVARHLHCGGALEGRQSKREEHEAGEVLQLELAEVDIAFPGLASFLVYKYGSLELVDAEFCGRRFNAERLLGVGVVEFVHDKMWYNMLTDNIPPRLFHFFQEA